MNGGRQQSRNDSGAEGLAADLRAAMTDPSLCDTLCLIGPSKTEFHVSSWILIARSPVRTIRNPSMLHLTYLPSLFHFPTIRYKDLQGNADTQYEGEMQWENRNSRC